MQNGNYIFNRKGWAVCQGSVHTLINKYQEFCQLFSLKQLITCPTRVTCNTSSLIDRILTNSAENFFQSGIIDCGSSTVGSCRNINWFFVQVKYQVQNLIRKEKREFYVTNLRQKISKPKELWKTLKSIGLPSKAVAASNICLKGKNEIVFNAWKNCSIFKSYFSGLAHNLVSKLPFPPNIFTKSKIASYYDNNAGSKYLNFQLSEMSPEKILSFLKGLNPSKAAGIDSWVNF